MNLKSLLVLVSLMGAVSAGASQSAASSADTKSVKIIVMFREPKANQPDTEIPAKEFLVLISRFQTSTSVQHKDFPSCEYSLRIARFSTALFGLTTDLTINCADSSQIQPAIDALLTEWRAEPRVETVAQNRRIGIGGN